MMVWNGLDTSESVGTRLERLALRWEIFPAQNKPTSGKGKVYTCTQANGNSAGKAGIDL